MFAFNNAPTTIKNFKPFLEDHDKQRVKTVRVWLELNRSSAFQGVLWPSNVVEQIEAALWADDESKRTGVAELKYDTVFENINLAFAENGRPRMTLNNARIEKISAKPVSGKALQIKCQALAITSDGDLEMLHDMLKSNGVDMTAVVGEASDEED
jgi:hypothetical protein